jgi:hypothetical protein
MTTMIQPQPVHYNRLVGLLHNSAAVVRQETLETLIRLALVTMHEIPAPQIRHVAREMMDDLLSHYRQRYGDVPLRSHHLRQVVRGLAAEMEQRYYA